MQGHNGVRSTTERLPSRTFPYGESPAMTQHDHTTRAALRHALAARRPAARSGDGRARGARSTRPPPTCSTTPSTPPRCSTWSGPGTSTRASPTPPWPCWRSASRRWRAASARWRPPAARRRCISIIATLMGAGGHIVASSRIYGGSHNMFTHTLPRFGITTTLVDPRDPDELRAAITDKTRLRVRRDARQPRAGGAGHQGGGRRRPQARAAAGDRLHLRHAVPVPAHRARRRHRHALGHQVPRRPRHRHRRHRRRRRPLRLGGLGASSRP